MNSDGLTRREWLTRGAGALAAAGVAAAGGYLLHDAVGDAGLPDFDDQALSFPNYFAKIDFPASSPRISVATGAEDKIDRVVRAAVEGLDRNVGMRRFISPGDVVLLKPNVGFDRPPYLGATTHPEIVRAVIRLCHEAGARKVIITDNPIESAAVCFAKSRIGRIAQEERADIVIPAPSHFRMVTIRPGKPEPERSEVLGKWPVLFEPFVDATKVIGIAPIKDHNLSGASMNLKNWYGLLGGRRNRLHQAIHAAISDLALMMSPTLVIADATRVMMRNGPTGGRISDVRPGGELGRPAVIASVDPVACDAWCCENLLGRDAGRLTYLGLAQAKIAGQTAKGVRRFGLSDWRDYERAGQIATTGV